MKRKKKEKKTIFQENNKKIKDYPVGSILVMKPLINSRDFSFSYKELDWFCDVVCRLTTGNKYGYLSLNINIFPGEYKKIFQMKDVWTYKVSADKFNEMKISSYSRELQPLTEKFINKDLSRWRMKKFLKKCYLHSDIRKRDTLIHILHSLDENFIKKNNLYSVGELKKYLGIE